MEPTEEQVRAFSKAWEAENLEQAEGRHLDAKPGDRVRAGLRALFATFPEDEGFTVIDGEWKQITSSEWMHQRHLGSRTRSEQVGVPLELDSYTTYWVYVGEETPDLMEALKNSLKKGKDA